LLQANICNGLSATLYFDAITQMTQEKYAGKYAKQNATFAADIGLTRQQSERKNR